MKESKLPAIRKKGHWMSGLINCGPEAMAGLQAIAGGTDTKMITPVVRDMILAGLEEAEKAPGALLAMEGEGVDWKHTGSLRLYITFPSLWWERMTQTFEGRSWRTATRLLIMLGLRSKGLI